jgi:hypothetical protein
VFARTLRLVRRAAVPRRTGLVRCDVLRLLVRRVMGLLQYERGSMSLFAHCVNRK